MSMPAVIICSSTAGSREDGPMVATIFVERVHAAQSTPRRATSGLRLRLSKNRTNEAASRKARS